MFETTNLFFLNGGKQYIMKKLENSHKIIDDLKNIEVKIDDEENVLLLLNSLPISFKHFKDAFTYGKEDVIRLVEV